MLKDVLELAVLGRRLDRVKGIIAKDVHVLEDAATLDHLGRRKKERERRLGAPLAANASR